MARLGMWLFLASEAMLFGAVFLVLAVYHLLHPAAAHLATRQLDLSDGVVLTAILLTSGIAMTLGARAARDGRRRPTMWAMLAVIALGVAFEVLKVRSWLGETPAGLPAARLYLHLYFVSTGLHALHLAVGIGLVAGVEVGLLTGRLPVPKRAVTVELVGLYWQFVDVVWIILFPTLYLAARWGPWGGAASLMLAAIGAGLLVWYGMRLAHGPGLLRLVAAGTMIFLLILFGLALADWLTRVQIPE